MGISLDLRAGTTFDLDVFNLKNVEFSSSLPLASTQLDRLAATQCLVFQPEATVTGGPAFAVATKALAEARSVAAAKAASSSSALAAASASSAAAASASASGSGGGRADEENVAHGVHGAGLRTWMRRIGLYGAVFLGALYLSS